MDVPLLAAPLDQLASGQAVELIDRSSQRACRLKQDITPEELATLKAGGLINRVRGKLSAAAAE